MHHCIKKNYNIVFRREIIVPREATLHVKLDSEADQQLNNLSYTTGKSKGQLVREALTACYQTSFDELPIRQRQAISAYQGGYISLGKLAAVMGLHVLEARDWLKDRGMLAATASAHPEQDADVA